MSWGRGEERIAGRGLGVRCGGGLSPGLPKQTQAQTYKLPKPDAGTPTSPLPPSPQTSAALAAAEPGLMANVLAPSSRTSVWAGNVDRTLHVHFNHMPALLLSLWAWGRQGHWGWRGGGVGAPTASRGCLHPTHGLNSVRKGRSGSRRACKRRCA